MSMTSTDVAFKVQNKIHKNIYFIKQLPDMRWQKLHKLVREIETNKQS